MKKYTLNNDKKEAKIPSDEAIKKHKSFDQLRTSYQDVVKQSRVPLYKNKKLFLLLVLIAAVAWAISESTSEKDNPEKEEDKIETNS